MEADLKEHEFTVVEHPTTPEEMTPPWEAPPPPEVPKREETPDKAEADRFAAMAMREAALKEREEQLAAKEREYNARERLTQLGLSLDLLKHFDFSSDTAVERMLVLVEQAALASRESPNPGPPPAPTPVITMPKTYGERANLFMQNEHAYRAVQSATC